MIPKNQKTIKSYRGFDWAYILLNPERQLGMLFVLCSVVASIR